MQMFHTEFGQAWNSATSYASNTPTKEIIVVFMMIN
jgi:hypothetical protein